MGNAIQTHNSVKDLRSKKDYGWLATVIKTPDGIQCMHCAAAYDRHHKLMDRGGSIVSECPHCRRALYGNNNGFTQPITAKGLEVY